MKLTPQQQAQHEQRQQALRRIQAKEKFAISKYKKRYYKDLEEENENKEEEQIDKSDDEKLGLTATQVEEMMMARKVDYNQQKQQVLWLPLHYYDDTTFNIREDHLWVGDTSTRLICLQKTIGSQPVYSWQEATLLAYDHQKAKFKVQYNNNQQEQLLPKLYCYFTLEKVEKFIDRTQQAMQRRLYADSLIRYKSFIENMPNQEGDELNQEQLRRVERQAISKGLEGCDTSDLISEVNKEYQHTMNKIVFDKCLKEYNAELLPHHLELPPPHESPRTYFGQLELEAKKGAKELSMWNYKEVYKKEAMTFTEVFKVFCLESIHLKKEIVKSLQEIKHQCNKIKTIKLFEVNISNSLKLEEFKQLQENQANTGLMVLKQEWVQNLLNIIKNRLGEIQKGWFSLKDLDRDNYENGKLKRYLVLVRQIMQDSLRDCIRDNYESYVSYMVQQLPSDILIHNCFSVENVWEQKPKPFGLFYIELQLNGNQFKYSYMPQTVVTSLMIFFDKLLEELRRVPDIENRVINDLITGLNKSEHFLNVPIRPQQKKHENKYIENFEWLYDLHKQLNSELNRGVEPLQKFIEEFEVFRDIVDLDHDQYMQTYEIKEKSADGDEVQQIEIGEISKEIMRVNELEVQLKQKVKEVMQVSFFQVNCKEICDFIIKKYQKQQKSLKEVIAKRAKLDSKVILDQFNMIQSKIAKKPQDIESLTEVKDFIANDVPTELENLQVQMEECMKIFDILDDFSFKIEKEDMNKKFKIMGSIRDTQMMIESREDMLEKEKVKFLEAMKVSQQEFKENMEQLDKTIKSFSQYTNIDKHVEVAKQVKQIQEDLAQYNQESRKFNSRENLFGLPQSDYGKLQNMIKEFSPYGNLWTTATQWFANIDIWLNSDWNTLDAVACEKFVDEGLRTLLSVSKFFREKQQGKILKIAESVREEILQFRPKVPLMVALRKQGMAERHWNQVSEIMKQEIDPSKDDQFNFQKVLSMGLMEHADKLIEVGETASKEYLIETMLRNMQKQWEEINWDLKPYKQTYILGGYDELGNILDEHILNTQQMLFSPYRKPFEQEIIDWNESLKNMSFVTEEWAKCQLQWMYLQPIFESPDIAKQLPGENKKFRMVDSYWKQSCNLAKQIQNVLKTCQSEGLLERLVSCNTNLDIIQKALEDYLEKKRESFPRFYFLANNDLIDILSQTKDPTKVQPHLSKVFENMTEVEFDENKKIVSMFSAEREKVDFVTAVNPNGKSVEHWMTDLEEMMKISVRHEFEKSVMSYPNTPRKQWVLEQKGQCVLNSSQVHWTTEVEDTLRAGPAAVKQYYKKSQDQLDELVELVRTKLSKQIMTTINALIVIDVHAIYVVKSLVANNIQDVAAFEWISFLRYYWYDEDCYVKCVQTVFPYGYEYLGNTPRLVITPLTDQCYMTLMGALKLNLGGAPAGPAGTGKTESTKDLAKALAKQCVVFNCSDQMDYLMVARMFKGLACSGAWCCFDEFNRINIEVLSVIAMQLQFLFDKKAKGETSALFEGSEIRILPTFSVFITMNPGYAGRTELPDNLKALFRPMAMMVPDYVLIAEIRLYSFGFKSGSELAKKMVTTFQLSSESLSSQNHYDYGMRAVSSVINAAGLLKVVYPDMDEKQLLLRALRDVNVPKFLKNDLPLFENIILDLFPGVEKPKYNYGGLEGAIQEVCDQMNLQMTDTFLAKVLQLYDMIQIRHGLMLVGPAGGGKTRTYQVLSKALSKLADQDFYLVENHVLNPKSVKMGQLYGEFNLQTKEWTDGVLANMIREEVKDLSGKRHWTVFDGPVDALWIESMNTVLDDNKKLCLNSGQIITLSQYMTMIFEVADLLVASPATVSRCGMVYMEPNALGYQPYLQSWFNSLPSELMDKITFNKAIKDLFANHLDISLNFNRKHSVEIVDTGDNDLVASFCKLLECYLNPVSLQQAEKPLSNEQVDHLESILEPLFFFCLIWSIGVTGTDASRIKFDAFFKEKLNPQSKIPFPTEATVYDYMFNETDKEFTLWSDQIKNFTIDPSLAYNEIMVQTSDSTRNLYLSKLLIINNKNMLITGPTGTGKTQNALLLLSKQLGPDYQYVYMAFSAQTSENQTQDTIDSKLERKRRGHFGPPGGCRKFVIFVDDLNMPKKEQYFAQPPIEILRQYLDHQGWYDRKALTFKILENLILFCAMGTPGGGRTYITPRMTRHFNIIGYTELEQGIVRHIFTNLSNSFLKRMNDEVKDMIPKMVESLLMAYDEIKTVFLPTPAKCHYLFNLRDISKVIQGVCWASVKHTTEPIHLVRLWYHEIMRVFHDRLTTEKDREDIKAIALRLAKEQMGYDQQAIHNVPKICFIDFMGGRESDNKPYYQAMDIKEMIGKIVDYQEEYNAEMAFSAGKSQLNLVLFLDACEHICRITRILRQPQGNALLLGVGGSGRQSLSKLASFIADYKVIQVELVKNYGMRQWRDDLKTILMTAGVENKATTFLFVDTQILVEQQVEDINSILNSGDVANLYQQKELDDIYSACKQETSKKGLAPNKMNFFSTYLTRVKRNFHLIFCMSPIGESFGTRVKMFPSLVNNCTLDLFTEWPEEALIGVGKGQIAEQEADLGIEHQRDQLVQMFKNIHKSVEKLKSEFYDQYKRNVYITPKSYLEQLQCYQQVLKEKRHFNNSATQRLQDGLDKLMYAEKEVHNMEVMLSEKQPKLEAAQKEIEILIQKIEVDKKEASEVQAVVAVEEEVATKQAAEANAIKSQAEAMVYEAKVKLDQTQADVKLLQTNHISEIKSFTVPSNAVKLVMGAVCYFMIDEIKEQGGEIIKKIDPDDQFKRRKIEEYYDTSKKYLLNNPDKLKKKLLDYDKEKITPEIIKNYETKIRCQESFNYENALKANLALSFLYKWCDAMYEFDKTYKETAPLREKLEAAEKVVREKTALLKEKKDALEEINNKITGLENLYNLKMQEQTELENDIEDCSLKLSRAQRLVQCLGDEKLRWGVEVKNYRAQSQLLAGDSVIAAGMISYSGPFTSDFRQRLETIWLQQMKDLKLEHTDNCRMLNFMGDPVMLQYWTINCGLPKDDTSTENGIIIEKSKRWTLMIDPQTQANKFIKNMGRDKTEGFEVLKASDPTIMRTLESSIQLGKWVLIENVGKELDPSLEPILQNELKKEGGNLVISIGDKMIQYHPKFKFFMTTTMPNPHYSPETFAKVSIINFSITPKGLEEQMLAQVVALENSQMEIKKQEIVKKNAEDKKDLLNIENGILKSLQEVKEIADVLKDENLIQQLQDSKKFAQEINQRVEDSKITEKQIDEARESYRPVAARASLLFFCIIDLTEIDPMYQYSLQWFQNLFTMGVQNSPMSNVLDTRLKSLNEYFTYSLYENICRSLFEKHKLLFSFLLTARMEFFKGTLNPQEWRYFLTGPLGDINVKSNPVDWIDQNSWPDIYKQIVGADALFPGIEEYFYNNIQLFKDYYDSSEPQEQKLPGPWEDKLDEFQKMIILKALRSDKIVSAVQNLITNKIGKQFIMNPSFDLSKCFKDSSVVTPLIFVLSPGSDPVADYLKFWDEMGMGAKYDTKIISLGQGQGKNAEDRVKEASQKGGWVLLQNCHLSIKWLSELEKIVEDFNENLHKDFRLWLTSNPEPKFPISILQNGIKMTLEPPQGLRNNLMRTYANLDDKILDDCAKPQEFKKLLFGFCLFHAIIQDRRKFGPIGWNIAYDFTNEDLLCCRRQLQTLLNDYDEIPYKVINFLGARVNYGGRVTQSKDIILITTILQNYINEEVLSDSYKFSQSGIYYSIAGTCQQDYLNYIENLPLNPSPEAFGLHDNAQITNSLNNTRDLLSTMLSISSKGAGASGKTREELIDEIATYVQSKTPPLFDQEQVEEKFPTDYKQSLNTILLQEVIKYNRLLRTMKESLKLVKLALIGRIGMSDELQDLANSLFDNQVPEMWSDVGFLSLKPLASWTNDLCNRCEFFSKWASQGTPKVFWFSGFFFPQAFITGVMQNYARAKVIAIDRLDFDYDIRDTQQPSDITESPEDGCLIYGLFLEGCRWDYDKHQLTQSRNKELFSDLPMMYLKPQKDRKFVDNNTDHLYLCPLYKVESRRGTLLTTGHSTNFVRDLELATDQKQKVWIKAGVAAFLSLRY